MTVICDDVYAEEGLDDRQLAELRSARALASANILRAFETSRASPLVLFCRSAKCKLAFGAPAAAAAAEDLGFADTQVLLEDNTLAPSAVVVTGPVSGTAQILTHELVHAEMKTWAPYDAVPTWFNEGTATLLASNPRCDNVAATDFDVTRLTSKKQWQRHLQETHKTKETYCAARHEVEKWMTRFDSDHLKAEALKSLLTSLANGAPFEKAFAAGG